MYLSELQHVVEGIPDTLSLARAEVLNVLQCNLKRVSYSARFSYVCYVTGTTHRKHKS
jgi:predicted PP-loop superfamily ATPase